MSIFNKITALFLKLKAKDIPVKIDENAISMTERENIVYGKDKLAKRRLYEKWACKELWLLYDEGIPLLFAIDPDISEPPDDELSSEMEELWLHAQDCVQKKLLSVVNNEVPQKEWKVKPVNLYCWAAVSRITVPSEFSTLMEFVLQTVRSSEVNAVSVQTDNPQDAIYQKHREVVLGAATSLLANVPDWCKNSKGQITTSLIAKQIINNESQWFGNEKPLIAESAMTDLINGYLKLAKPIVK